MKVLTGAFVVFITISIITSCKTQEAATGEPKYTYSADVKPIIDASCGTKCHKAEKPAGGIDLTTYANVKKEATEGELLPAIRHDEGAEAMPRKADKLSDSTIAIIEAWVESGAPE